MSYSNLLIHKVNTYDIGFAGSDVYNNPIRMLYKDDANSNLGCRVQRQITKERAYSLSEIELLEEVPVNSFFDSTWNLVVFTRFSRYNFFFFYFIFVVHIF